MALDVVALVIGPIDRWAVNGRAVNDAMTLDILLVDLGFAIVSLCHSYLLLSVPPSAEPFIHQTVVVTEIFPGSL